MFVFLRADVESLGLGDLVEWITVIWQYKVQERVELARAVVKNNSWLLEIHPSSHLHIFETVEPACQQLGVILDFTFATNYETGVRCLAQEEITIEVGQLQLIWWLFCSFYLS